MRVRYDSRMYVTTKQVTLENTIVMAELQLFEDEDRSKLKSIYQQWLSLSSLCEEMQGRRINIPEIISEGVFSIEFGCARFLKCTGKISSSFDCLRLEDNARIQVKATSVKTDLTSFGPKSTWDEIYLIHFLPNDRYDGAFSIYKIEDGLIYNHKVNRKETFRDQQMAGKRPRFSIMKDIIIPHNIKPSRVGNILDYR